MKNITSLDPSSISTVDLHKILLTAVAPRPIALASTVDSNGRINLSPFSFFNVFSANPPILIFSPARRVRDNSIKHTLENVKKTKEVVINIVNFSMVEQVSLSSTEYEEGVNEFEKAGLTGVPSIKVSPPRVKESPVSFECVVDDIIALGDQGGAGNLVICRVVFIHIDNNYLDQDKQLDTKKLDLVSRMGGNWYSRCTSESIFEIPKPLSTQGIGVDKLPKHIYQTDILSGNDLGRLGNSKGVPSKTAVEKCKKQSDLVEILKTSNPHTRLEKLHKKVKEQLNQSDITSALITLFCI